ncbi:MAG: MBL fold metallo-hydrolase [Myxococcales bacterium]|nr:MBL fold metallo-hydrolase [Myxococcales bacterium]
MDLLFHHDVVVSTLASGSRGNCTYIGTPQRGVLVDCGLSTKQVLRRMEEVGLGKARIEAVLITHEHADHVGAARILDDRLLKRQNERIPFFMTAGTKRGVNPRCMPKRVERITSGQALSVAGFDVEPYRVPHDTGDPVAFLVSHQRVNVCVVTDLGRSTRLVERQLSRCDIAVIEFNHDLEMLLDGPYPWSLKQRVRGGHGHLSNAQAEALVAAGASDRLRHLVLAHLSEDNNLPERALEAAERGLNQAGVSGVEVRVASQQLPLTPMRVGTPATFRPATKPRRRTASTRSRPATPPTQQLSLFSAG